MSSYKNPYVRESHAIFKNRNLTRPTADLLFKKEMQESPDAVLHLLNNVLRPKIPFVSVTFRNVEIPADIVDAKTVRLDVLGHLNDGTNVELILKCSVASVWPLPNERPFIFHASFPTPLLQGQNTALFPVASRFFSSRTTIFPIPPAIAAMSFAKRTP